MTKTFMATAGMQRSGQVLSVLVSLKDTAESFVTELQQNLAGVDAAELQQIAAAVYVPFESQIARWDTKQFELPLESSLS